MKALKIVGGILGAIVGAVVLFGLVCAFAWREPDPKETCSNIARFSADPKLATSNLAINLCVKDMSRKAYGFFSKKRLASYRRCLHEASSASELARCDSERAEERR